MESGLDLLADLHAAGIAVELVEPNGVIARPVHRVTPAFATRIRTQVSELRAAIEAERAAYVAIHTARYHFTTKANA
jgi:hypothetical protein